MELDLTIYTYGHLDAMYYILNGIAMVMSSGFAEAIITTTGMVATFYYGIKAAYASSSGGAKQHLMKLAGMVLVINGLLTPVTTMKIEDHVTKQRELVENIPIGLALPVGIMEKVGDLLTEVFEQAFTPVANDERKPNNYRDYGMVFGARLVQETRKFKITTPNFAHNMENFIRRCVAIDAAIGKKYNLDELMQSDNIWELVTKKPSQLRNVELKDNKENKIATCKESADWLTAAFTPEISKLAKKFQNTSFGRAGSASGVFSKMGVQPPDEGKQFKANINRVFGNFLGSNKSAAEDIKQYMMIHSMSDYGRTYGFARASMTQETNWRISGDLATLYLPMLLTIMKCLVYASFVILIPTMLMGGGMGKYLTYISVVASLQLWPALNAVLNMFIDLYSASNMKDIAGGGISFTSYSSVGDYSDKIVAVASGLQMVIPYLAFNIIQGGVGGFIHLASSITGASTAAAGAAAGEVTTGNKSFDNYSAGNTQVAMQQGFKTDFNSSYKSGASEVQHSDGTMERTNADGTKTWQSGVGMTMSGGSVKFNMRESQSGQIAHHLSDAQNLLKSEQRSYHEADRETFGKTASFVSNLAQRESKGETFDYSKAGEQGKALQRAVDNVKTLRENYGYDWTQAANATLDGKIPLGGAIGGAAGKVLGGGVVSKIAGLAGGMVGDSVINLSGSVSASNNSNQSFGDEDQVSRDQRTREDYNNVVKASSNEQFATTNNIDKSYSDDIRRSVEKQKSAEISMNTQADRVESLSTAYQQIQSMDGSYDKDMYDAVQKNLADKYHNGDQLAAHKMIENHDPRVATMWGAMVNQEVNGLVGAQISAAQVQFSDENKLKILDDAANKYNTKIETNHTKGVVDVATGQGLDPNNKEFVTNNVKPKVDRMMDENDAAYTVVKNENEAKEEARQKAVDQYEKDRIGQGKMSKFISVGTGIGGPTKPSTVNTKDRKSEVIEAASQIPTKEQK